MNRPNLIHNHASYALKKIRSACVDLVPIVAVVAFVQFVIIRKPLPNLNEILLGAVLVVIALGLGLSAMVPGRTRPSTASA